MKRNLIILFFAVTIVSCQSEIKVACVGDSITNGGGLTYKSFYPGVLGEILGEGYQVLNFGESGATMQTDGNKPYWKQKDFQNVLLYNPDVVVIMLGTNDSKTQNWNPESFQRDYQAMIDTLNTLASKPEILLCFPPPAYSDAWTISDSIIRNGVSPIVQDLAHKNQLEIINVYKKMSNLSHLFPDGIHPNDEGKVILAKTVAAEIKP